MGYENISFSAVKRQNSKSFQGLSSLNPTGGLTAPLTAAARLRLSASTKGAPHQYILSRGVKITLGPCSLLPPTTLLRVMGVIGKNIAYL